MGQNSCARVRQFGWGPSLCSRSLCVRPSKQQSLGLLMAALVLLDNTHTRAQLQQGVLTGARHRLAQSLRHLDGCRERVGYGGLVTLPRGKGVSLPCCTPRGSRDAEHFCFQQQKGWRKECSGHSVPAKRNGVGRLSCHPTSIIAFGARTSSLEAITAQNGPNLAFPGQN